MYYYSICATREKGFRNCVCSFTLFFLLLIMIARKEGDSKQYVMACHGCMT